MKVVYIKAGIWGDFIYQDNKIIPCKYGDFKINKDATERDLEEAKEYLTKYNLIPTSIELLEVNL